MRQSALFSVLPAVALLAWVLVNQGYGQEMLKREGGGWVRTIKGTAPPETRLRLVGHGPVTVEAGVAREFTYTVAVKVLARTESEARRKLANVRVQVSSERGICVVNVPGGEALSTVTLRAPRLSAAEVSTSDGTVDVRGVDGSLSVHSRAGELFADRIQGDCDLVTGGGAVSVGQVYGNLRCSTGAGRISVKSARGQANLVTDGGDIAAEHVGGEVTAQTRGGGVHIGSAGGAVNATSGGGEIVIEHAAGQVSAQNMAGPVRVSGAVGVHCVSTGAVAPEQYFRGHERIHGHGQHFRQSAGQPAGGFVSGDGKRRYHSSDSVESGGHHSRRQPDVRQPAAHRFGLSRNSDWAARDATGGGGPGERRRSFAADHGDGWNDFYQEAVK